MNEEDLPPQVKYWLSPDTKHDCYFSFKAESGQTERIGAFKAFLIGYSEPLRSMLQDSELAEQEDICLVDIELDTFKIFLKCLYMGLDNTFISKLCFREWCDLLYVADKYLVTQLKDDLVELLLNFLPLKISYIFDAMLSEVFILDKCLEIELTKTVQAQIKHILFSTQFLDLTDEDLLWILDLDPLDTDETSLWKAVLKWAVHKTDSSDGKVLRECISEHLQHIRFRTMNVEDFCIHVIPTEILTQEEVYEICKSYGTNSMPNVTLICNVINQRRQPNEITFPHCFYNISNVTGSRKSNKFKFHGYNWYIKINIDKTDFGLFVICQGCNSDPLWEFSACGKLILLNHKGTQLSKSFIHIKFCVEESVIGFKQFCSRSDLLHPLNNYIHNNSITVLVNLKSLSTS